MNLLATSVRIAVLMVIAFLPTFVLVIIYRPAALRGHAEGEALIIEQLIDARDNMVVARQFHDAGRGNDIVLKVLDDQCCFAFTGHCAGEMARQDSRRKAQ